MFIVSHSMFLPASSAEQSLGETRESLGETRGVHIACRANRETARGSALLRGEGAKPATKPTVREASMCTGQSCRQSLGC